MFSTIIILLAVAVFLTYSPRIISSILHPASDNATDLGWVLFVWSIAGTVIFGVCWLQFVW